MTSLAALHDLTTLFTLRALHSTGKVSLQPNLVSTMISTCLRTRAFPGCEVRWRSQITLWSDQASTTTSAHLVTTGLQGMHGDRKLPETQLLQRLPASNQQLVNSVQCGKVTW